MELTLERQTGTQITSTCDGHPSHTFQLPTHPNEQQLLYQPDYPINYGKTLYTALFPVRILDTRARPPSVGPAGTLTLTIGGMDGVPTGATAVILNVTVTNPTADSFITAWPSDQARPLASDLNCVPGQTIPNLVVVKLSPSGQVSFYNSAGNSDLVVDLFGSYS